MSFPYIILKNPVYVCATVNLICSKSTFGGKFIFCIFNLKLTFVDSPSSMYVRHDRMQSAFFTEFVNIQLSFTFCILEFATT